MNGPREDKWSTWLRSGRYGSDESVRHQAEEFLFEARDRVLQNAALSGDEALLDIGTGEGLIGLGAMELLRPPRGLVIFTDISQACLDRVSRTITEQPRAVASSFLQLSADNLAGIEAESIDVVTARSVLIYVKEKQRAFDESFRVLRRSGRISFAEPINRDRLAINRTRNEYYGYDVTPIAALMARIKSADQALDPDNDPMTDFSYIDLVEMSGNAGFAESHITVRCDVTKRKPRAWESFVGFAPNPNAGTIGQEFQAFFSRDEQATVESH
ncbi:MAG TPA: class I SAM-dependent methyltransferase, partial [Candidatus Cybelea sp.]